MILDEGLPEVFARHEALARATRAAMQALGLASSSRPTRPSFALHRRVRARGRRRQAAS